MQTKSDPFYCKPGNFYNVTWYTWYTCIPGITVTVYKAYIWLLKQVIAIETPLGPLIL